MKKEREIVLYVESRKTPLRDRFHVSKDKKMDDKTAGYGVRYVKTQEPLKRAQFSVAAYPDT
jgi:hypothetical protein